MLCCCKKRDNAQTPPTTSRLNLILEEGDGLPPPGTKDSAMSPIEDSTATNPSDSREPTNTTASLEAFDWDSLYEEDEVPESSSEPAHPSVFSYVWSQLKVGMDLTKITLPTYILERRSLLEMYSDFFAHPDMFVSIADAATPKDRLVAVTKWYLSSFHAGRRSDVAKKPYNPILGEVFNCWWSLEGSSSIPSPKFSPNSINDRNRRFFSNSRTFLPWSGADKSNSNSLIFFGEQVSHHPPISAFYAEAPGHGISLNAWIWTKSKFLGLSVGVVNVGDAVVRLEAVKGGGKGAEEYVLGFPSGYARSILSVPWVELGGDVKINCPQTGYCTTIEFCTKNMLGSNRNRIIAKLYAPSEKKPFLTVDGLWNDVMIAKESNTKFVDVKSLRIWRKEARKLAEQELYESRRLWKDVTRALKVNDVDGASGGKRRVEERQRLEAKAREEKSLGWKPRLFEKVPGSDRWAFVEPLGKRMGNLG